MLQDVGTILGLCSTQFIFAQQVTTQENAAIIFSGSQGFLVLIAGLVLAFAFQLLLTNFFIALGISYSDSENRDDPSSGDLDYKINHVGTIVGLRALGTVSITLFIACFLAVKLCLASNGVLGAILGLVIWAAYFSLLVWVSVTTVGSVLGSVVNKATSGLQGIVGTATIALGARTVSDQVVSTAETAADTIRRELSSADDSISTRQAIDNYLKKLQLTEVERQEIQIQFEKLVADPEMKSIAKKNHLENIRRQTFVDIVSSRTDLSKQDLNWALNQFEGIWQQMWGQQPQKESNGSLLTSIKTEQPEEQKTNQLSTKLERLIEQTRKQQAKRQAEATQKVAETAAWWLFGTAFFSAIASALAGSLSVRV